MTETPCYFDIRAAAEYLRSLGFSSITSWTVRTAINSGRLAHTKQGKKFYVSKDAIAAWLAKSERRVRA